jgi:HSP20 family molecular chaperone IbpA
MTDPSQEIAHQVADQVNRAVDQALDPQPVPVNMYEADDALVVVAALPGVMADDVDVVVTPRLLTIEAGMRTAAPKRYLLHEWHYGPYFRELPIPSGFGREAHASFGNGQLAVRLLRGDADSDPVIVWADRP